MRVLIIEDEQRLSEALVKILARNKIAADTAQDGEYGLDCAVSGIYDVIILDIMLPKMDGIEVLSAIRKHGQATPVLLLTAKDGLADKVRGLDAGADDYLCKPFETEELLARIRALGRRSPSVEPANVLCFSELALQHDDCTLHCRGRSVLLSMKEYLLMELFIRNAGRIVSKEDILLKVWGYDTKNTHNSVEVYVSFLRKKLHYIAAPAAIKAVRGAGYRLESIAKPEPFENTPPVTASK